MLVLDIDEVVTYNLSGGIKDIKDRIWVKGAQADNFFYPILRSITQPTTEDTPVYEAFTQLVAVYARSEIKNQDDYFQYFLVDYVGATPEDKLPSIKWRRLG